MCNIILISNHIPKNDNESLTYNLIQSYSETNDLENYGIQIIYSSKKFAYQRIIENISDNHSEIVDFYNKLKDNLVEPIHLIDTIHDFLN